MKNVGTPYTIYFGRGLYSTFMDAYASVDNGTRRKMDEMLKTWKEPVPGSVDPRPVFSPETTRPIENALIKARTSALQAQHEHMRSEQQLLGRGRPLSAIPYRETPTPPGSAPASRGYPPQGPYGQQPPPQQQQTTPQQAHAFHPVSFSRAAAAAAVAYWRSCPNHPRATSHPSQPRRRHHSRPSTQQ